MTISRHLRRTRSARKETRGAARGEPKPKRKKNTSERLSARARRLKTHLGDERVPVHGDAWVFGLLRGDALDHEFRAGQDVQRHAGFLRSVERENGLAAVSRRAVAFAKSRPTARGPGSFSATRASCGASRRGERKRCMDERRATERTVSLAERAQTIAKRREFGRRPGGKARDALSSTAKIQR